MYLNGTPDASAAARNPWAVKTGLIKDRNLVDDAYPNNWLLYADNAAATARIHALILADINNQTYLNNPNGVLAFAMGLTQLATPATPVITNAGTAGVTSYSYKIVARSGVGAIMGTTPASAAGSTTTGNGTLTVTNYNIVTFASVAGASSYDVYRTAGGATQGRIGTVVQSISSVTGVQVTSYAFNDTGFAADGTTAPTTNSTGLFKAPGVDFLALTTPVGGVATPNGTTGATTYTYVVVARSYSGTSAASASITTTTGNATLSTTNFVAVTWNPVPGAVSYDVYRTAGGATQGLIKNVASNTLSPFLNDTGLAGDSSTAPSTNSTGSIVAPIAVNYIATETGANNALAAALLDSNGNAIPLAAGLRILLKTAHSAQAGANTLALNGGATKSIKKATNPANDIGTAFVSGSLMDMAYDGTVWQLLSQ